VTNALSIQGVWKSFGALDVLRGIDLEVAEHEVIALIGASGSGKSTLLRCINLLEPIDEGRIFIAGEEITAGGWGSCSSRSTCSRTCACLTT